MVNRVSGNTRIVIPNRISEADSSVIRLHEFGSSGRRSGDGRRHATRSASFESSVHLRDSGTDGLSRSNSLDNILTTKTKDFPQLEAGHVADKGAFFKNVIYEQVGKKMKKRNKKNIPKTTKISTKDEDVPESVGIDFKIETCPFISVTKVVITLSKY